MFWKRRDTFNFIPVSTGVAKLQGNCESAREKVKVKCICGEGFLKRAQNVKNNFEFWVDNCRKENGKVCVKVESHPEGVSEKRGKKFINFSINLHFLSSFFRLQPPKKESEWVWKMWKPNSESWFSRKSNAEIFPSQKRKFFFPHNFLWCVQPRGHHDELRLDLIRPRKNILYIFLSFWKETRITFFVHQIIGFQRHSCIV